MSSRGTKLPGAAHTLLVDADTLRGLLGDSDGLLVTFVEPGSAPEVRASAIPMAKLVSVHSGPSGSMWVLQRAVES